MPAMGTHSHDQDSPQIVMVLLVCLTFCHRDLHLRVRPTSLTAPHMSHLTQKALTGAKAGRKPIITHFIPLFHSFHFFHSWLWGSFYLTSYSIYLYTRFFG